MVLVPRMKVPERASAGPGPRAGSGTPLVEVERLTFRYDGKAAVRDVTITFFRHRIAALIASY